MNVDYAQASASVVKLREHAQRFRTEHDGQSPAYNPASAGRGFVGHGQRLAQLLTQLHERSGQRAATMDVTAQSAQRELDTIRGVDTDNSDALGRHLPEGGA